MNWGNFGSLFFYPRAAILTWTGKLHHQQNTSSYWTHILTLMAFQDSVIIFPSKQWSFIDLLLTDRRNSMIAQGGPFPSVQESNHERMGFEMLWEILAVWKCLYVRGPWIHPMSYKFPKGSAYQAFLHVKAHVGNNISWGKSEKIWQ